jgi:hypothetical protein
MHIYLEKLSEADRVALRRLAQDLVCGSCAGSGPDGRHSTKCGPSLEVRR